MNTVALAEHYRRIREQLLTDFPELREDEQALLDTLDGETEATDVITALARQARSDEAFAAAADHLADEMSNRARRYERRSVRGREAALSLFQAIERAAPIEAPDITISVRATPPKIVVEDEAAVPAELFRVVRSVDRMAVREALKSGPVPGVRLTNGGQTLALRAK